MKCNVLLTLFTLISTVHCRHDRMKDDRVEGTCVFKGYVPGGNKVTVQRITAPIAQLQGNILGSVLGKGSKVATGVMHSMKLLATVGKLAKTFASIAPALGPALGVFGVVLGGLADLTKPTPADILKATNKAIAKLTDEVNNRMDEMKGYVDQKVIDLEKTLIDREYKSLFIFWSNCINERTFDLVNECQRDAAKNIIAAKPKFQIIANGNDVYNTKRLEASLLSFRDYVVLSIMCLKGLANTYKPKIMTSPAAKFYYDRYNKELKEEVTSFVKYVEDSLKTIVAMHYRNGEGSCQPTYKCDGMHQIREGFWLTKVNTADWTRCSCVFDPANVATKTCKVKLTVRVDGKLPGSPYRLIYTKASNFYSAAQEYGERVLSKSKTTYLESMKSTITNYWKNEVLDLIPNWKAAAGISDTASDVIVQNSPARKDDDYSHNYRLRSAKAFDMVNKFDDDLHRFEVEDEEESSNNYRLRSKKDDEDEDDDDDDEDDDAMFYK